MEQSEQTVHAAAVALDRQAFDDDEWVLFGSPESQELTRIALRQQARAVLDVVRPLIVKECADDLSEVMALERSNESRAGSEWFRGYAAAIKDLTELAGEESA